VPSAAPPSASEDGDGQPDHRDPEADGAHDDTEPAKHVHSSSTSSFTCDGCSPIYFRHRCLLAAEENNPLVPCPAPRARGFSWPNWAISMSGEFRPPCRGEGRQKSSQFDGAALEEEDVKTSQPDRLDGDNSVASIALGCWRTNSRQVTRPRRGAGGTRRPRRILAMPMWEIPKPSLSSLPWILR